MEQLRFVWLVANAISEKYRVIQMRTGKQDVNSHSGRPVRLIAKEMRVSNNPSLAAKQIMESAPAEGQVVIGIVRGYHVVGEDVVLSVAYALDQ